MEDVCGVTKVHPSFGGGTDEVGKAVKKKELAFRLWKKAKQRSEQMVALDIILVNESKTKKVESKIRKVDRVNGVAIL